MKLRLSRDSIRFRLSMSEVAQFGRNGRIEERLTFATQPQNEFLYRIERSAANEMSAIFTGGQITVYVPQKSAREWVESDQVGIENKQPLDDERDLSILIEKDFVCRTHHSGEDQSDNYPNPKDDETC